MNNCLNYVIRNKFELGVFNYHSWQFLFILDAVQAVVCSILFNGCNVISSSLFNSTAILPSAVSVNV